MPDTPVLPVPIPREWVIDKLLPLRVVSLLVGPPGVSKTSLAIQELSHLPSGGLFLGYPTRPTEVVFVSCDRSREEHDSHCHALGVDPSVFHFHDQVNSQTTILRVVNAVKYAYPRARLIFIDGFARLVPEGKLSDYTVVANFLCECLELAQQHNITIMGCLHAGKAREGATYADPRDQVCGSVAWAGYSNLMIVMQKNNPKDTSDPVRLVHILTRSGRGDITLKFTKDPDPEGGGGLIPLEDVVEEDLLSIVAMWLRSQSPDRLIPKREIVQYARDTITGMSERSIERWLQEQIEPGGLLVRPEKGKYRLAPSPESVSE